MLLDKTVSVEEKKEKKSSAVNMPSPWPRLATVFEVLGKKGIRVMEYGDILNARFGYPICVTVSIPQPNLAHYTAVVQLSQSARLITYVTDICDLSKTVRWCVPDSQVSEASNVLLAHDVPLLAQTKSDDEWDHAGAIHTYAATRVHLLPLSLTGLSLDDCVEEVFSLDIHQKTLVPAERQYLISLIRMLRSLPMCRRRNRISVDLMVFLEYRVFPRLPEHVDEQNESEEHFQWRVGEALSFIRQWDWKPDEQKYLSYSEDIIRDCNLIETMKE